MKYFELSQGGESLACLRYIRTLVEEITVELLDGYPSTTLWSNIYDKTGATFLSFMDNAINICVNNFSTKNNAILDYSMDFFKKIYTILKRNDHSSFGQFYDKIK